MNFSMVISRIALFLVIYLGVYALLDRIIIMRCIKTCMMSRCYRKYLDSLSLEDKSEGDETDVE